MENMDRHKIYKQLKELSSIDICEYFTDLIKIERASKFGVKRDVKLSLDPNGEIQLLEIDTKFRHKLKEGVNIVLENQDSHCILDVKTFDPEEGLLRVRPTKKFIHFFHHCIREDYFDIKVLPNRSWNKFVKDCLSGPPSSYDVLFPSLSFKTRTHSTMRRPIKLRNKDIASNDLQIQAIEHIVLRSSHPFPYVLFGPPGTGKTSTLVEAILQIHLNQNQTKILVCCPSNTAVDVLATKVRRTLSERNIIRIVSKSKIDAYTDNVGLEDILMFGGGKFKKWLSTRSESSIIVFCTAFMGGVLSKRLGSATHVFYDEAGFSTEPETIFAILPHLKKAFIVLSGDPYQLGPVVNTLKLKVSLMERLMHTDAYYMPDENGRLNPIYATKLINNYRSLPAILKLPSDLFYNAELKALAIPCPKVDRVRRRMGIKSPLHFINIAGESLKQGTSLINRCEAAFIKSLLDQLCSMMKTDGSIGVISPYKAQYELLRRENEKEVSLEFGSPELFQGREKDIIIVSTVRSLINNNATSNALGFLNDFRRFNVALTRARFLCVVVGDAKLLKNCTFWNELLEYTT